MIRSERNNRNIRYIRVRFILNPHLFSLFRGFGLFPLGLILIDINYIIKR